MNLCVLVVSSLENVQKGSKNIGNLNIVCLMKSSSVDDILDAGGVVRFSSVLADKELLALTE